MPDITLNLPKNSLFNSSLNEIDVAMSRIFLNQMRIADPRDKSGKWGHWTSEETGNWLWDESRIFQVDDLSTEEIFNTYLLRKKINNKKDVDITYPILAYIEDDIDTVFWGTGNRYRQNDFNIPVEHNMVEVGDNVLIADNTKYRGLRAQVEKITQIDDDIFMELSINGVIITDTQKNLKKIPHLFNMNDLRPSGNKIPKHYKAKAITGTYTAAILCDNRDEIQYIRDKFILRCADAQIWHKYKSPTIENAENQIFTVFDIPNIEKHPDSKNKLTGEGYIYSTAFKTHIWGCLTDEPLPQEWIEQIRMNMHIERVDRVNRIVIG